MEKIKSAPIPRTNPVNLIFVLSQYAPKVSETHFYPPRDFFDLVMRSTLSSRSRAKAFLWLIWWYLESDFSREAAENNPFGRGQHGDMTEGLPLKVPPFEHLTEEQANAENIDTEPEKAYGEMKRLERKRILEDDETVGPPIKRTKKSKSSRLSYTFLRHHVKVLPSSVPFCETNLYNMTWWTSRSSPFPHSSHSWHPFCAVMIDALQLAILKRDRLNVRAIVLYKKNPQNV